MSRRSRYRYVNTLNYPVSASLECVSAATEVMDRDCDHCDDQQDVNKPTDGFLQENKSQQPQDQQHDTNSQEHSSALIEVKPISAKLRPSAELAMSH